MSRLQRAYGRSVGTLGGPRRLLQLHAIGINACREGQLPQLMHAVEALHALLPHEPDMALRLQLARLYLNVAQAAHAGDFARGEQVLTALHGAWRTRARQLLGIDPSPPHREDP